MPIAANAAIASACRALCQSGQHSACSHVCMPGSVPNGRTTAPGLSALPHHAQRPGADGAGCRFIHSTTQHANARASASSRGILPSNSAIAARSSKKTCQSSTLHSADVACRAAERFWAAVNVLAAGPVTSVGSGSPLRLLKLLRFALGFVVLAGSAALAAPELSRNTRGSNFRNALMPSFPQCATPLVGGCHRLLPRPLPAATRRDLRAR
jgi:hypothetical protein